MPEAESIHKAYDKVLERTGRLFDQQRKKNFVMQDRWFAGLLLCEWIAGMLLSLTVSSQLWAQVDKTVVSQFPVATLLGSSIIAFPIFMAIKFPGHSFTRHSIAIAQMLMSGLLIQLTAGRMETHFHIFGSLAILAFYRDWRILITASAVALLDQHFRGIYWPHSVYGVEYASPWRVLEHGGWIAFEDLFLVRSIITSTKELWDNCQRQSELEATNVIVEARVEERTRELKVTEERFRLLSSASPIGIVLTDASGDCLYVNRRWEDLSGILHDACLDKGWLDCIHPDDKDNMLEKWMDSIGESNEHVTEFRVEREDKPISWLHSRVTSIGDSEGISRGYIWTFEDITERKNAEANLLMQYVITDALAESSDLSDASPKLLKAICTNRQWSLAILWMLDAQDDVLRYEGSWCADEPALKQLVENSRRMTFGRGEGALGIPLVSGQPFIAQSVAESNLQGRMDVLPERFGYMSFPVTEDEQVFGVLEFMSDEPIKPDGEFFLMLNSVATQINQFAEQMSAEMRLKDSDARIRAMLESAIDGIVTFDLSGIVELVNPAFERILGFDADDVLGRPIAEIVPGETTVDRIADRKISTIQNVLDDLKAHNYSDRELIVRRSDGTLIPVEFRVSEVVLGTRNFYSGIIRDITERKEVELRVSEFYSTVSHELRTPLTSIRGALGLMEGGVVGEIPEEALELVTIARVSCDRLIRLINDILDLRKIEAGKLELKLESLDSESMVKATADSLRMMCEEYGVSIAVHVNDKRPVKGDHDRVVQILTNLVSNAVKFSGPAGKLDVRVVGGTNGAVRFEVEDNGPGIPESQMHRLFGKFQQLDSSDTRAQGGTGLGLAISKALVEKHNGRIGVKSIEKKGSTFWFEIPADQTAESN